MKLVIPGEMPDLNQIIKYSKQHWSTYSKLKRKYTDLVFLIGRRYGKIDGQAYITFRWYCKDKRKDPDNIAAGKKFILDGLVKAGVFEDDTWKQIKGFRDEFYLDPKEPRIEVEIKI